MSTFGSLHITLVFTAITKCLRLSSVLKKRRLGWQDGSQVKVVPVAKPDDLGSLSRSHVVEGENSRWGHSDSSVLSLESMLGETEGRDRRLGSKGLQ